MRCDEQQLDGLTCSYYDKAGRSNYASSDTQAYTQPVWQYGPFIFTLHKLVSMLCM